MTIRFDFYVVGTARVTEYVTNWFRSEYINVGRQNFHPISDYRDMGQFRGSRWGPDDIIVVTDDPGVRDPEVIMDELINQDRRDGNHALWLWYSDGSFHLEREEILNRLVLQEVKYRGWQIRQRPRGNISVFDPGNPRAGVAHLEIDRDGTIHQQVPIFNRNRDMAASVQWEMSTAIDRRLFRLLAGMPEEDDEPNET